MLKRNLIANYMGQGWTALMGFAFIPLFVRYLGVEAYGVIGLFATITACMALLDAGMAPTVNREMARFCGGQHTAESIRDLLRSVEWVAWGLGAVKVVGVYLIAGWLAHSWLNVETLPLADVRQAIVVMGFVSGLSLLESLFRNCILGLQRQVLFNVLNVCLATVRNFGAWAVLAWVAPTLEVFFLWQAAISLLMVLVFRSVTYSHLPASRGGGRFSWAALRQIWRFAGGVILITLLSLLLTQSDKILLSRLLPLTDYGYYTLAATAGAALYTLVTPIVQAFSPRLCQLTASDDVPELARTYHFGAQLVTVILGSACLVLMVFPDLFLQVWTRDEEIVVAVSPVLRVLIAGFLLNGFMWIPYSVQLAHGWTSLTIWVNGLAVLFIVPSIWIMTSLYGAVGAAWCWVLLNALYVLFAASIMYRKILVAEKWRWYLHDLLRPLAATVVLLLLLRHVLPPPETFLLQAGTLVGLSIGALLVSFFSAPLIRSEAGGIMAAIWTRWHTKRSTDG